METSRSPLELFRRAHELGCRVWEDYDSPFSRHDFTRPQLFACLALRELLRLSYRKIEAFLIDVPQWLAEIGMSCAPDHNTLWRAFGALMATDAKEELSEGLKVKPLTIDSTCYEPHHRSRHYDRVCRKIGLQSGKYAEKPGKYGAAVNASRSRQLKRMPKLALATAAASHRILAVRTHIGNGSDCPDFEPLLFDAWRRADVKTAVADAGYDSEDNHCLARLDMGVRSVIPPKIGRPSKKLPEGYYRRMMKRRFKTKADAKTYGQRAQSETTNSMMKRNLSDSLRSIKPERREQEMMLRALVHNLMLPQQKDEGRD
jgi:IS5 family transposase